MVRVWCACMFVCVRLHLSVEHTFSGVHVPCYLLARQVSVTICDLDLRCCVHTTTFLELNFHAICLLLLIHTLPAPCPLSPPPYCAAQQAVQGYTAQWPHPAPDREGTGHQRRSSSSLTTLSNPPPASSRESESPVRWWWWWWFVSLFSGGLCHW